MCAVCFLLDKWKYSKTLGNCYIWSHLNESKNTASNRNPILKRKQRILLTEKNTE